MLYVPEIRIINSKYYACMEVANKTIIEDISLFGDFIVAGYHGDEMVEEWAHIIAKENLISFAEAKRLSGYCVHVSYSDSRNW